MDGFKYNGVHSSAFGCHYIPSATEQGRDTVAYEVEDLEVAGRDGGYYVGNSVRPREFTQDCYVEEITAEMREGLLRWLDRNTSGRQVFDEKPFVYYDVRPVKRIEIRQYTHRVDGDERYSGTFTVAFRCYGPFGKLFRHSYSGLCGEVELIQTGILPEAIMPIEPLPTDKHILLYNCGTERANTRIRLAGDVGEGLIIDNITTGQQCKIVGLRAGEIPPGAYIEIDSETGQVWLMMGEERELAFHYHDLGYIQLAPCTPFVRSMRIRHEAGSKRIETDGSFLPHMVGQFIRLDSLWRKIHRVQDARTAHLVLDAPTSGETDTPMVTMNEVWLRGDGMGLAEFAVGYTPRMR